MFCDVQVKLITLQCRITCTNHLYRGPATCPISYVLYNTRRACSKQTQVSETMFYYYYMYIVGIVGT